MNPSKNELISELERLVGELRSLGVEQPCRAAPLSGRSSIRPVTMDRRLADEIVSAISRASNALTTPRKERDEGSYRAPEDLSQRQKEILTWVALGKSNSVIASILGISRNTVDTHLRRVFERLDTTDRTVAAIRGIEAGLISPHGLKAA